MRAHSKFAAFLFALAALLVLSAGAWLFMFPGSHINRIKEDSPLFLIAIKLDPPQTWEQRIRDGVLQQLPLDSTRQEIQTFLQRNFVRVPYVVTRPSNPLTLARIGGPHVFIHAIDDSGFSGRCQVEIYLLLTP